MSLHVRQMEQESTCFPVCKYPGCWRDKGNQWPMAAYIKALRWQNFNEAQAHLSTTWFHMQVAGLCSHRSCSSPLCPDQRLARPTAVRSPAANKAGGRRAHNYPAHKNRISSSLSLKINSASNLAGKQTRVHLLEVPHELINLAFPFPNRHDHRFPEENY